MNDERPGGSSNEALPLVRHSVIHPAHHPLRQQEFPRAQLPQISKVRYLVFQSEQLRASSVCAWEVFLMLRRRRRNRESGRQDFIFDPENTNYAHMDLDKMDVEIEEEIEQCEAANIHLVDDPLRQSRQTAKGYGNYKAWLRTEEAVREASKRNQRDRQKRLSEGRAFRIGFWVTVLLSAVAAWLIVELLKG